MTDKPQLTTIMRYKNLKLSSDLTFWMLLLVNLTANAFGLHEHFSLFGIFCVVAFSGLTATVETYIIHAVTKFSEITGSIFKWVLIGLCMISVIIDVYTLKEFGFLLYLDPFLLVISTPAGEAKSFIESYVSWEDICVAIICSAVTIFLLYRLSHIIAINIGKKYQKRLAITCAITGTCLCAVIVYLIATGQPGLHIPAYSIPTRIANSYRYACKNSDTLRGWINANRNISANARKAPEFDIVFIVGESFNRYHASPYGYEKNTMPHIMERIKQKEAIIFTDVYTSGDITRNAMTDILSMSALTDHKPYSQLFPAIFRKAGYFTAMYNNNYIVQPHSAGIENLVECNPILADICYDRYSDFVKYNLGYDTIPADFIERANRPGLYFIHLYGQHFTYRDRFPKYFTHFKPSDYNSSHTENQRRILADYDNATLYNDHIVNEIINLWENRDAVIIYISDHGEEVFDCRDFFGHSTADISPCPKYQLDIPMFVITTEAFRAKHPDKVAQIRENSDRQFCTGDIGHLLVDLADIDTPSFDPKRSVINPAYDESRPRMFKVSHGGELQVYD